MKPCVLTILQQNQTILMLLESPKLHCMNDSKYQS